MSATKKWQCDDSYALSKARGSLTTDSFIAADGVRREWLTGHVITLDGIVTVYSQGQSPGSHPWTHYSVVIGGRLHHRSEQRVRSKRALATLAARFAREKAEAFG